MGMTMGLNLLLLIAMVATNILSLYHLSSTVQNKTTTATTTVPSHHEVPDHLIHQLSTIRATINHLTHHHPTAGATAGKAPPELLLHSQLSPIASACHSHPDLLHRYMNYTPFSACPPDSSPVGESLILRGCHPLPRRRCFSKTPAKPSSSSLPQTPFPESLPDSYLLWDHYECKSFKCLNSQNPDLGFDLAGRDAAAFSVYNSELDLPVPQLVQVARAAKSTLRLAIDLGGGTGGFAAQMKSHGVTVITTTMNVFAPFSETAALRGLVPIHAPLQQRLPVSDGVLDLVRCGRAVNRWIPAAALEFLLFDADRVLRPGGYLWLDHFFAKSADLEKTYAPLVGKLGYRKVKWATAAKGGAKSGNEVYLTALLQKPVPK